ncbi:hypothetical protein AOLI_G00237910 [Acnodon oligacanthus]
MVSSPLDGSNHLTFLPPTSITKHHLTTGEVFLLGRVGLRVEEQEDNFTIKHTYTNVNKHTLSEGGQVRRSMTLMVSAG